MFRVYPRKIDVFVLRQDGYRYLCSTHAYRLCRDARRAMAAIYNRPLEQVKARFHVKP